MVAPHGGYRHPSELPAEPRRTGRRMRINDLHTADTAALIAESLGGSLLVNHSMDRNRLDLNRITQVRSRAPWFLEALARLIAEAADTHEEVWVLVVHGWNINQSRCDLGVGANLERSASIDPSKLTVSVDFTRNVLESLRHHPDPLLHFTRGDRYPARHRNNLLQIFRRDGSRCDELPDSLAATIRDGRCQAVQLELGIPLRWPGEQRDHLVGALTQTLLQPSATSPRSAETTRARRSEQSDLELPYCQAPQSLQVFDADSGVAVLASVDSFAAARAVFGRVAIFLPDGRVALYTGEARNLADLGRDGPVFRSNGRTLHMSFDGSVLLTPDGDCYIDLEYALGKGTLESARIELNYEQPARAELDPGRGSLLDQQPYGMLRGSVAIGSDRFAIDSLGFSAAREWGAWRRAGRTAWSARLCLDDGGATVLRSGRGRTTDRPLNVKFELGGDGYAPSLMSIAMPDRTLHVRPMTAMSIARPVGLRRRARVTFGPAAVEVAGSSIRGTGIFEYARLIDR